MNIIIYFLGIFSALFSFILSFPFYEQSYLLLGSCFLVVMIQYMIYKKIDNKKKFYVISISLCMICLVLSLSGLFYIKDVILNKYMEESIYTFEIMGKYNYYHHFFHVFITMSSLILPFNTLYIYVFEQKKYILSIFVLFPFIFVEVLFTITPPLYGMPYILYCMVAVLSHHQNKIHIMPIVLSFCFMLGLFYIVSPTSYVHPRQTKKHNSDIYLTTPGNNAQSYRLEEQGNRYYVNRVELRVEGITQQSFLLREMIYDYFDGQWQQTTSSYESSYMYLKNVQALSQLFECQVKKINVVDIYHQQIVYVPYFYCSSSDTLKYFDSHFEGEKEEPFEIVIPNQQWNDYLSSSDENKYDLLYNDVNLSVYSLGSEIYDDTIPDDTRQVLNEFMDKHQLYDYENCQDLIKKATKAIHEETEYSLTPGVTPDNENFFDYFLNKNKKGYCVHYASTLALILRMCGFNAHFVTGYQVDGSHSFEDYTVVYDSSAHAWVEVEDPILGYIPIEATPASSSSVIGNQNQTTNQTSNEQTSHQTQQQTIQQDNTDVHFEIPRYIYFLCIVLLVILMIYLQSRIRLKRQWKHLNKNQEVCLMYYHFQQLHMLIDLKMVDLFKKAKFSSHQLTEEEYQQVFSYYQDSLKKLYKVSSIFNKIKLKIIYAYI